VAALLRFPGAIWPIKPDEAGLTLVARNWQPEPNSLYGTYWVDRPPSLIAFIRLSDWIAGPLFLRVIAAIGCFLLVLASAATARTLVRLSRDNDGHDTEPLTASAADEPTRRSADRVAVWTAVFAAFVVGNLIIDPTAAKGEILGIPLVMTSFWLSLRALERRSATSAFLAGLLAVLAVGLKQNMVAGLVFGGVVLVGSFVRHRLTGAQFLRMSAAALAGALVPVVATVSWAVVAGVRLRTVWYTVYGFRSDAMRVINSEPTMVNEARQRDLLLILLATGMIFAVAWFLLNLTWLLRRSPVLSVAALAAVAVDCAGLVLGGSYWPAYAFVPIPSVVVCLTLVLGSQELRRCERERLRAPERLSRGLVVFAAVTTTISVIALLSHPLPGTDRTTEYATGEAIGAASQPGDTLVVYGGRADIQFASGLASPYKYLWSLPMRTLDPELHELRGLLEGPDAPTWFVAWAPLYSWGDLAEQALGAVLEERYTLITKACDDLPVYLRKDRPRPALAIACDEEVF
jgi:hypothetical protein